MVLVRSSDLSNVVLYESDILPNSECYTKVIPVREMNNFDTLEGGVICFVIVMYLFYSIYNSLRLLTASKECTHPITTYFVLSNR